MTRKLVTTALQDTWGDHEPLLFLGDWCKLIDQKTVWEKRDFQTVEYHWNDRDKFRKDYLYLQDIYEQALKACSKKLNLLHDCNHPIEYWRMVIGSWLGYFSQILFDRWEMIQRAIQVYDIQEVDILKRKGLECTPLHMNEFTRTFVSDNWNEYIYSEIIRKTTSLKINFIDSKTNISRPIKQSSFDNQELISKLFKLFPSFGKEVFMVNSYLSPFDEIILYLKTRSVPRKWFSLSPTEITPDSCMRNFTLETSQTDPFLNLLYEIIPLQIPTIYLEGFDEAIQTIQKSIWPRSPKVIFTSTSYSADDMFKIYAAEQKKEKTTIVIGQHGGGIGTHEHAFYEDYQISIADKWLSWGWASNNKKIKPVGHFKYRVKHKKLFNYQDRAVMVLSTFPRYSYHLFSSTIGPQGQTYLEHIFNFIHKLPENIQKKLYIKDSPIEYGLNHKLQFKEKSPLTPLTASHESCDELILSSKICINTYNATTLLDSLRNNTPTLIYWDPKQWEVRESSKPYFDQLHKVGILHYEPEPAAQHFIKIWDDPQTWWGSPEVQSAKDEFCHQYCRSENNILDRIAQELR